MTRETGNDARLSTVDTAPSLVLTVAAFIFDADGRLLLINENYGQRRYGPPGGRVEPGELPADAVVREVREETTLRVTIDRVIGLYAFADEPWQAVAFRCRIIGGAPCVPPTSEIAEVGWFEPTRLPTPQTVLLRHALADALSGQYGYVRSYPTR